MDNIILGYVLKSLSIYFKKRYYFRTENVRNFFFCTKNISIKIIKNKIMYFFLDLLNSIIFVFNRKCYTDKSTNTF